VDLPLVVDGYLDSRIWAMSRTHDEDTGSQISFLMALLALLVIVLLGVLYVFSPSPHTRIAELAVELIPEILGTLVAFVFMYFLFYRRGIGRKIESSLLPDPEDFRTEVHKYFPTQSVAKELSEQMALALPGLTVKPRQVVSFCDTYRQIDWTSLLKDAHVSLDIVVHYYDSWVRANHEILREFFMRPRTTMRVFLSDPEDASVLAHVTRLFPEYPESEVKRKILDTAPLLAIPLKEAGADPARLQIFYVPFPVSYSAQCIDNRALVVGVFEMFRKKKIDSPAFVIDLTQSEAVTRFWHKELDGLLTHGRRAPIAA